MPASCSSGLRSLPSAAAGSRRSNGLDVNSVNSKNPVLIRPMTASTRATIASSSWRDKPATASVQPLMISDHSRMDPS